MLALLVGSLLEVPVARALLGVGERLCVSAFWADCSSPAKRAIATFQVFGSLVLFAAATAAGGTPAEAVLAASGGACGSPSTRASARAAIWLAPRLTCSKSRPSAELKPTVVSRFSKALSSPVLGVSAFAAAGTSEEFVHPLLQLLPRHVGGLRNLRRRMPPSGVKGAWSCPRG